MDQVNNRMEGFTLIELLLVLSIVVTLSVIVLPSMSKTVDQIKVNQFLKVLESDIFFIQNQASEKSSKNMRIIFTKDYYMMINSSIETKRQYYPKTMEYRSINKAISFSKSGTIKQADSFHFKVADQTIKIIFPFGKGRYYIERY